MFSCCRCANNPKKDGKPSKKDKQKPASNASKDNKEAEIDKPPEVVVGMTADIVAEAPTPLPPPPSSNDNEKQLQSENEVKNPTTNVASSESIKKNNNLTEAATASEALTTKTNHHHSSSIGGDDVEDNQKQEKVDDTVSSTNDTHNKPQDNNDHSTMSSTSPNVPTNCDNGDSTVTVTSSNNQLEHSPLSNESSPPPPPPSSETSATQEQCDPSDLARSPLPTTTSTSTTATTATTVNEVRPKSCLSRHNSSRSSIKKRVNINNSTEIIATPDLPSIDDDEVFSDSIPPQKRENMCAPYVENGGDGLQGRFGLPEWFNEERFNDINFMDPPVTPVGRDELELRRHRLYSDLITAAQAAVDSRVRFNQFSLNAPPPPPEACDPDIKPSVAADLEHLLDRLERLVERLERSVSARDLEIANRTLDTVLEKKRNSFDLESTELPPIPKADSEASEHQLRSKSLNERIERIENSLSKLNDSYSKENDNDIDGSLENIPTTVLEEYLPEEDQSPLPPPPPPIVESMSVLGYQDIVNGPLSQYLVLSQKIGGDVAAHAKLVKAAFDAQLQYVILASESAKPSQDKQTQLLKPTSDQISAIQSFREKNRASPFFNHLSAISESIPALGWVCVAPTPGPHVKEMNDAGQFYTNRVLKDWKEKDPTHVEWARAWVQTLTELQQYIKQYHTTGLVWSGKGAPAGIPPPPPSMAGCPPPPPPPAFDLSSMSLNDGSADERSALFAEINQGEAITKNLKKVTADMQTHKNPTLRTGPAPFKAPQQFGQPATAPAKAVVKEPVFTRDGKKWLIEYQKSNPNLIVENAEMNNVVYMFRSENSTLTIKGKVNNVVMDSCKKCSLLFDSVVSSVEFVNCQSVQMQVLGSVPTVSIDKTDGCQMYLSKDSLGVAIISSKSSEMNVSIPMANGDFMEQALPEQFRTTIQGTTLKTVCVDSLG